MPCNLEPSTKRHKAQARIALLFVLIALALTVLPTASFAGTDTAGNVWRRGRPVLGWPKP